MRFNLVDQIVEVEPNQSLTALKNLTSGEEYLADHFPSFPVMPGVLMLQALVESAAWLLRLSENFKNSIIVLRDAKNVKYGSFLQPGSQMLLKVNLVSNEGSQATFKGQGEVEGKRTVNAKFTVAQYNLRDKDPELAETDEDIVKHYRSLARLLQKS
mgnify:CR=1 FL=1